MYYPVTSSQQALLRTHHHLLIKRGNGGSKCKQQPVATHLGSENVGIPAKECLIPKPLLYSLVPTSCSAYSTSCPKERRLIGPKYVGYFKLPLCTSILPLSHPESCTSSPSKFLTIMFIEPYFVSGFVLGEEHTYVYFIL